MQVCCPFDRSHIVDSSRLLRHIEKCKSTNRQDYSPCPFNQLHWLPHSKLDSHTRTCPDRNQPSQQNQPKEAFGTSEISVISVHEAFDQSAEIYQLGLDFERHKPPKNEIEHIPRKRINKREMRELNRPRLWQEPNFAEWFDTNYDNQQDRSRQGGRFERGAHFLIDDEL